MKDEELYANDWEYIKEQLKLIKKDIERFNVDEIIEEIDSVSPEIREELFNRVDNVRERLEETKTDWEDIFIRIIDLLKEMRGRDLIELFVASQGDYDVWCALWLRFDGHPYLIFPFQREIFDLYLNNKKCWVFACRQTGKTTTLAAEKLYTFFLKQEKPNRKLLLAPGDEQHYLYSKIYDNLNRLKTLSFIRKNYFSTEKSGVYKRYCVNDLGNSISRRTIDIREGGSRLLGESDDEIVIDEVQRIPRDIKIEIINPMLSSKYSDSSLEMIGTPHTKWNKDLLVEWEIAKESKDIITKAISWDVGVSYGITKITEVDMAYKNFIRDGGLKSDEFNMWYEAKFPSEEKEFYSKELLKNCFDRGGHEWIYPKNQFIPPDFKPPAGVYVFSADFAEHKDNFVLLIGRETDVRVEGVETKGLKLVYSFITTPQDKFSIDKQIDYIKMLYWIFRPIKLYVDGNRPEVDFLVRDSNASKAIPQNAIYSTNKGRLGVVWGSEIVKSKYHHNNKLQMRRGTLLLPNDVSFFSLFVTQHLGLNIERKRSGDGLLFKKGKVGDDLVVATCYLNWHLNELDKKRPAAMKFMFI